MRKIQFLSVLLCFMWQSSYSQTLSEDRAKISPENNPFEIVDFVAESSFPLMIVIKRYRNSAGKDFISRLGYYFRENF